MEHGWIISKGRLFDPTIVLVTMPDQPITYFPGVIRTYAEMEALENEFFPHVRFEDYGEDGMQHAGYRAAYEAAKAHALAHAFRRGGIDSRSKLEHQLFTLKATEEEQRKRRSYYHAGKETNQPPILSDPTKGSVCTKRP